MDRHKSALKRNRQNIKRRMVNRSRRTFLRHQLREFHTLIEQKDWEKAQSTFPKLKKCLDQAAQVGTIRKNVAARQKSRLSKKLNLLLVSQEGKTKVSV